MRFLLFILLFSCEKPGGTFPIDTQFKHEMKFEVNGKKGVGVMVADKASRYKIKLTMKEKPELIKLSTCHREYTIEKSGWSNRKSHVFDFVVADGIENVGYCPISIGTFDMQGQHAWGMIEIKNQVLSAEVLCNGEKKKYNGVSVCQSREGLQQRITFGTRVQVESTGNCGEARTKDEKTFDLFTQKGVCSFIFLNGNQRSFHRLTMVGYDDVMLKRIDLENHFPGED